MASGDIIFILLFIVLPTTVIVSGFWVILFVARNPDRSISSSPAHSSLSASVTDLEPEPLALEEGELLTTTQSTGQETVPTEISDQPADQPSESIDDLSPVAADLLAEEAARREATATAAQQATKQAEEVALATTDEEATKISPTEEIPELADPMEVDLTSDDLLPDPGEESLASQGNIVQFDTWRADSRQIERAGNIEQAEANDDTGLTIELDELEEPLDESLEETASGPDEASAEDSPPEPAEPDSNDEMTANLADLEAEDHVSLPPQPNRALLVPSHTAERKNRRNSRSTGRQVPQISRSIRRDESVVERGDSVSDL